MLSVVDLICICIVLLDSINKDGFPFMVKTLDMNHQKSSNILKVCPLLVIILLL